MKLTLALITAAATVCLLTPVQAQDARVAPGTVAPDSARQLPNGETAPAPDRRVTGGVGANEVENNNAQPVRAAHRAVGATTTNRQNVSPTWR